MVRRWKVSIVYDSPALPGFTEGWGFSALISSKEHNILFDCGWDGHLLRDNLSCLGLGFSDLDAVIISHSHWDHLTGLLEILGEPIAKKSLEVIVPAGFSKNLMKEIGCRAMVREVETAQEISPDIWASGPMGGEVPEQVLILRGESQVAILTGCGHTGLAAILAAGSSLGIPRCLIGGLHDCTLSELEQSHSENQALQTILCHCTRCKAEASSTSLEWIRIGAAGETYNMWL